MGQVQRGHAKAIQRTPSQVNHTVLDAPPYSLLDLQTQTSPLAVLKSQPLLKRNGHTCTTEFVNQAESRQRKQWLGLR